MDQQQAGAETHRNRAGLLLALGGFITLSAGDGIVKSTAGEWPAPAVAALRYVFGTAALGVLLAIRQGRAGFVVSRMGIQFGRGASVAMATLCFFVGVQLMPLADVTAIQFVSPVFVALLSPLMLGERTPLAAWVSTLVAMTGVMIVLRPNLALGPAALLPVLAALGMALLVIFNRKMAGFANILALQFWIAVIAAPLLCAAAVIAHFSGVPDLRITVPNIPTVLKCAAVAYTGTAAHWLIFMATERASASLIAPMVYVQLLLAAVIGWAFFGDHVDAPSAFGMLLIVLSGLLLWRSQRQAQ